MASKEQDSRSRSIVLDHVKKGYSNALYKQSWRNLPAIPTGKEIFQDRPPKQHQSSTDSDSWREYQEEPIYDEDLPHNIVDGPWPSIEEYIGAHYQIIRKDAIASLQHSVNCFKNTPSMMDDRETCIYTHVTFKGLLLSRIGVAFRVEFSHERSEKQIRWQQSKRLIAGTIVALTPESDMFRSVCKIAVVAARPYQGGLDQDPPQIDLFWGDIDEAVFDPVEKYVMIEARSGYFESARHMLVAMQKLMTEKFNFADNLVFLNSEIGAPKSIKAQSLMNLNSLVNPETEAKERKDGSRHDENEFNNVDVLQDWPKIPHTGMDFSQMQACKSMLREKLAIVQGPPGTGKTFISVAALRVMVDNWSTGDPPIIVSAQTNHALDQLLTHVLDFCPEILRLGGRCDPENKQIVERTLYNLRMKATIDSQGTGKPSFDKAFGFARREFDARSVEIRRGLDSLFGADLLTSQLLYKQGIITEAQMDSLNEEGWGDDENDKGQSDLASWLTKDQTVKVQGAPAVNQGLPMEDTDIEFEQLQELEQEMAGDAQDVIDKEGLRGEWLPFRRLFTGRHTPSDAENPRLKRLSAKKNLYDIPRANRGEVYRLWEKKFNRKLLFDLRSYMVKFQSTVDDYEVTKSMSAIRLVRNQEIKIIGCTTTGLSKYRGMIAALQPKTVLIEEAAETLEGTIIAGMIDSLEQLILVGDHEQLQAHCNIRALEGSPYNLNISMFERLVNNGMRYTMLNRQRRMITDIRQLLTIDPKPFYKDLHDHESVWDRIVNRPPIPGMGGKDTYFFHHNWPEACNSDASRYNKDEAEMVAGFFSHLIFNGVEQSSITVLTFYNGQRKTILKELKNNPSLDSTKYFKVHTVDSYQGEENDIILLSLVRSNQNMGIGFLDNKNRLVVALSRARRGLYIFGNTVTLTSGEEDESFLGRTALWLPLIKHMRIQNRFNLDDGLPITCQQHNKTLRIFEPGEWYGLAGGCSIKCQDSLPCGHPCPYRCHPFTHEEILCKKACPKKVPTCGHSCSGTCGQKCFCELCRLEQHQQSLASRRLGYQQTQDLVYSGTRNTVRNIFNDGPLKSNHEKYFESTIHSTGRSPRNPPEDPSTSIGGVQAWLNWDARAFDQRMMEEAARQTGEADASQLQFRDTFRPITTQNGRRERVHENGDSMAQRSGPKSYHHQSSQQHDAESSEQLQAKLLEIEGSLNHPHTQRTIHAQRPKSMVQPARKQVDENVCPNDGGISRQRIANPAILSPKALSPYSLRSTSALVTSVSSETSLLDDDCPSALKKIISPMNEIGDLMSFE